MLIAGLPPVAIQAAVVRAQQPSSGDFAVPPPASAPEFKSAPMRTSSAASISGSTVLALQERLGRDSSDQEARQHGHRLLDELARLQRALLSTGDDPACLESLADLARIDTRDAEPALAGVLSSIRLRARIELERRLRRPASGLTTG